MPQPYPNQYPLPGTKLLLGLGLNFCIKNKQMNNNIEATIKNFKNDARQCYFIVDNQDVLLSEQNPRYSPCLDKNSMGKPPAASAESNNIWRILQNIYNNNPQLQKQKNTQQT